MSFKYYRKKRRNREQRIASAGKGFSVFHLRFVILSFATSSIPGRVLCKLRLLKDERLSSPRSGEERRLNPQGAEDFIYEALNARTCDD
jgi:hypothetical protein